MHILYKAISAFILLNCALPAFSQSTSFNELVWNDEFEGEGAPNPAYWSYDLGTGQGGWGNNEVQSYTSQSSNVRRSNGLLVIEANKINGAWTSARIKTQGKYNFTYGRIEYRAKLPKGSGTWPALWMLGESINTKGWPACGEIDVMEHVARDPGKIHATLHTPSSYGNTVNTNSTLVSDYADNFHVYAAEWTPEAIKFFVDNNLFYTYTPVNKDAATWPFNDPQFIIINLAMGGGFGSDPRYETNGQKNGIDPALTTARFEVDYVRVYQGFKEFKLSGPTTVTPDAQNLIFKASQVTGATYTWEVPEGATVTSGAGSSEIKVKWGQKEGAVRVHMELNGQVYQQTLNVNVTQTPEGEVFLIEDFSSGSTAKLSSSGGNFVLNEANGALKVDYQITNPNALPQIVYTLTEPLNMSGYPVFAATIKTKNESGTVILRFDLKDAAGNTTGTSKVFTLTPLIDDGEFYTYFFDYSTLFGTGSGQIDGTKVKQIRLLVDYGIFGSPGSDSFWIDQFFVLKRLPTTPNRPSHLSLTKTTTTVKLNWQDNAANETNFKIYRARSQNGPFEELMTVSANTREYTDPVSPEGGYVYKVQAVNGDGTSGFSNLVASSDNLLSIKGKLSDDLVTIYPNPCSGEFQVQLKPGIKVNETYLFDALGKETGAIFSQKVPDAIEVRTAATPGLYFCHLYTPSGIIIKKVLIN
ncbi:family 16 glycosylhydrolase [Pontibacter sp. MBLB2868]|uniref:family 16 glycosylhydrolase n=1 Tax=Pontibacter sp. MBLB2868 TaxID=3451555 RepID=UPI003F751AD1